MSVPAPAATLERIQRKVRDLTGSPSESQLTTDDLNDYINTFILYDFPEHIRLFTLRETLVFYTEPNVDVYDQTNTDYDPNTTITVTKPIYIAGYDSFYTESREQFYRVYPQVNFEQILATGSGVANYTGTVTQTPFLQNNVTIGAVDSAGNALQVNDDGDGNLIGDVGVGTNTVNYTTGAVDVTFSASIPNPNEITIFTVPYVASRPEAMLFFDNQFILRPVPDKIYRVEVEIYRQPSYLMNTSSVPELKQWWQYIAYGAAKKVLEDRQDMESLSAIMPGFKEQERLVLRRTIVQQTNERVATIYTEQTGFPFGYNENWRF
jgi:hypothetical protein